MIFMAFFTVKTSFCRPHPLPSPGAPLREVVGPAVRQAQAAGHQLRRLVGGALPGHTTGGHGR